jgi:hypothetical protein
MIAQFDRTNQIIAHADHFARGTPDEAWVQAVAAMQPRPIVILGDGRILRNPALKIIAKESNLSYVVMGESFTRTAWNEQAWKFVKVWPEIVKQTKGVRRPTIFDVGISNLKVTVRFSTAELR